MLLLLLLLHLTPDDKQTAARMSRPAAALVALLGRASCEVAAECAAQARRGASGCLP